jgi:hypothetical protein
LVQPDAVFVNDTLPDGSYMDVVNRLQADSVTRHIPVAVMRAISDGNQVEDMPPNVRWVLERPLHRDVLEDILKSVLAGPVLEPDYRDAYFHDPARVLFIGFADGCGGSVEWGAEILCESGLGGFVLFAGQVFVGYDAESDGLL